MLSLPVGSVIKKHVSDYEWLQVTAGQTASDYKWLQVTASDFEWLYWTRNQTTSGYEWTGKAAGGLVINAPS